jgi:hypothetical protein
MTNAITDRVQALEQRLKALKAKGRRIEARKRAQDGRRERRDETRRHILVGAIVLARVKEGQFPEEDLKRWLDAALSRQEDRELFDLPRAGEQGSE